MMTKTQACAVNTLVEWLSGTMEMSPIDVAVVVPRALRILLGGADRSLGAGYSAADTDRLWAAIVAARATPPQGQETQP